MSACNFTAVSALLVTFSATITSNTMNSHPALSCRAVACGRIEGARRKGALHALGLLRNGVAEYIE